MRIKSAKYIVSSPSFDKCPKPDKPEFAFIGRSNVGKSSLINMLVSQKNLAKTSSTPGKTQLINHFEINEKFQPLTDDDLQLIQPIVNNMTFTYSCACTIKKPNYILLDKWKIVPVNSLVKVKFF
jgi:ribosome biogenesis GTPase A